MNPFLIKGYKSPEYFYVRLNEAAKMQDAIENSGSLVLYRKEGWVKLHY